MAEPTHPLLQAIDPLINRIGAAVIDPVDLKSDDIPLRWDGNVVAGIRLLASDPAESADPQVGPPDADHPFPDPE